MKRFRRLMRQCPLAVCILGCWGILAAGKYLPLLKQQWEQEQAGPRPADAREGLEGYGAYGGAMAANRAPDLTLEELGQANPGASDFGTGGQEPQADVQANPEGSGEGSAQKEAPEGSGEGHPQKEAPEGSGEHPQKEAPEGSGEGHPQKEAPEDSGEEHPQEPEKILPEYISYDKKKTNSPYYSDPGKIPLTTEHDYVKVSDDYFDDAVFIGDSRMEGMEDYSGLHNATFFAKPGLTVFDLLDDTFIKDPENGKKVSVSDMLKRHTYGKIYLMVGINELGTGGTERFAAAYKDVLKKFRKWQPDAVIYVHSIMGVSPAKDKSDAVFNNTNIRDKNYAISKLTDGIHIFYFNIQQLYEDKKHNLAQELTFDDVHLYAKHYGKWVDYLREHAVEEKKK